MEILFNSSEIENISLQKNAKKIRLRRKTNEKDYPDFTDFSERSGIRIRGNRGGSDRNRQINSRRREESDKPEGGEKKDGKTLW